MSLTDTVLSCVTPPVAPVMATVLTSAELAVTDAAVLPEEFRFCWLLTIAAEPVNDAAAPTAISLDATLPVALARMVLSSTATEPPLTDWTAATMPADCVLLDSGEKLTCELVITSEASAPYASALPAP